MEKTRKKQVFRVRGFTCADCAARFERKVKELPGVVDAKVNFGAAKITVFGEATIEELEKAGAFENLKLAPEESSPEKEPVSFWHERANVPVAALLLAAGWLAGPVFGWENPFTILAYAASILAGGYSLFKAGLTNLFRLQFDMKALMTVAVLGSAAIGEWGEGATVVILFAVSEALESYSMERARRSIRSLMDLAPKEALIRRGNAELHLPVEAIEPGDILIVKPGEKIAMDGIVQKGASTVNQAPITGESVSVPKQPGDEVFAGTLNEGGLLEVLVTKKAEDTTIAKIIHLVEEAQAERAPAQKFVDRFAKSYTPAIMLAALLVALLPPLLSGGAWGEWLYRGLALLVVGCPCALVISTPIAVVTAVGNAAKNGVLIKGGIHLEEMGALSAVAFDKTGTLTKGNPEVTEILPFGKMGAREALALAAALEQGSRHPLASAIVRKAEREGLDVYGPKGEDFSAITGRGLKATIQNHVHYIGNPQLFAQILPAGIPEEIEKAIESLQKQGKTIMVLGTEKEILALFAAADPVRESSREVIQKLHRLGIKKTILLTGDNRASAEAVGQTVGIGEIQAELLPQEKLDYIQRLRKEGHRIAMVGDGVNDAPALAASTVGIAMGGAGSDTALETADIALMADDLRKLPYTIRLSRKTLQIIRQNIAFSLGLKAIALLLIIPGWLTLWMAVFADMGATLLVSLNSMRLLKVKD